MCHPPLGGISGEEEVQDATDGEKDGTRVSDRAAGREGQGALPGTGASSPAAPVPQLPLPLWKAGEPFPLCKVRVAVTSQGCHRDPKD